MAKDTKKPAQTINKKKYFDKEADEIKRLKEENYWLRMENDIIKKR